MLPLDQLILEPTLTYSSPPFQSESKQANDMPNQPMHHRLGSSSSMSQSFLLTPSHITVWKVIARSKDEEISANWLQRSCNIHISTPTQKNFKTSAIYVPTCWHTSMYLYSTFHLFCTCQHSVHLISKAVVFSAVVWCAYVADRAKLPPR